MNDRTFSPVDNLLIGVDRALRTVLGSPQTTGRSNPSDGHMDGELDEQQRQLSLRLMRVNHAGEVAAQALYQGQALTAQLPHVREKMEQAALEESDHLAWCENRVKQLGGQVSYLNPVWYLGSFSMGALAGWAGDRWSLGFVAETEKQVIKHLDEHLDQLPAEDEKSRAVIDQMKVDEQHHATVAIESGAAKLPQPIKKLMALTSKVMTKTAYWV